MIKPQTSLVLLAFIGAAVSAQPVATDLEPALAQLKPQRPGVVDAYVVVAALDPDPVFGREAREAARVLADRFDAEGRTIVLAEDEAVDRADGAGTMANLARSLERAAALMDRDEDVLVFYSTSHGSPNGGIDYKHSTGSHRITPPALAGMFGHHGFKNRLIMLQACYSGQFIPALAGDSTVVATAASSMQPSFGCTPGNDWTFFGHALINIAMRKPDSFARQFRRAFVAINAWERQMGVKPSNPQISIGKDAKRWLDALDARAPKAETQPVGRPPAEIGN